MTLWKINKKHMNCMLTEEEIKLLGYELEELKASKEKTEEFLKTLLDNGKNLLDLDISEGVKSFNCTYLQNNTIFLSISCAESDEEINTSLEDIKTELEEVEKITENGKIDWIKGLTGQEKIEQFGYLVGKLKSVLQGHNQPVEQVEVQFDSLKQKKKLSYNIKFESLESVINFSHIYPYEKTISSSLFKENELYYLITDFSKESKEKELTNFVLNAEEFGGTVEDNPFIRSVMEEHGSCIVRENALMELAKL